MYRKLVIIGNGLGMALSPKEFSLEHVMPKVWREKLEDDERDLIASCLKGIEDAGPSEESQLMGAQLAQLGHELISQQVAFHDQEKWFQKNARYYPRIISKYVYEVARQLNENSKRFENDSKRKIFFDSLIPFLGASKSHVATLNYDTLLYSAFNENYSVGSRTYRICDGWEGSLVDGYTRKKGFSQDNFIRQFKNSFGYYLHLHGSPLFVGDQPKKLGRHELDSHQPKNAKHVILSDGALKPLLIERSQVLKLYWDQIEAAISEAKEIIIFGYGGGDEHLNVMLKEVQTTKRVVVRRKETDEKEEEARRLWQCRLSQNSNKVVDDDREDVIYESYSNILDFNSW